MASPVAKTRSVSCAEDSSPKPRVFLTAEWRYLAMLNYAVDPALLLPRVPVGTELELLHGKAFVSLVGFCFLDTRVWSVPVPFHRDFEEVNLRFYVRRRENGQVKRGVVFIQEIVPRRVIAMVARLAYHENYRRLPMSHRIHRDGSGATAQLSVQYAWRWGSRWNRMTVRAPGEHQAIVEGSDEQFIAEHYWGYSALPHHGCLEYRVSHEPWLIWNASEARFEGDAAALYGSELGALLHGPPCSAFLAQGSPVAVYTGRRLDA